MKETDVSPEESGNNEVVALRAYEPPSLVRLGDVRDFTLGGSRGTRESGNTNAFRT